MVNLTTPDQGRVYHHLHAARDVLSLIRSTLDHCGLFAGAYAVTSRLKSADRMISKIADRQSKGLKDYDADSITDTVGVRIITHYHDEIPEIVKKLLSLITGKIDTNPNNFKDGRLIEFLQYVPHLPLENDPFSAELREIYVSAYEGSPPCRFDIRPRGGYSSIHMVLRFPSPHITDAEIGVEVQIRSVFEDAWGQIDHKLAYEQERRMGEVDPNQREFLKKHLLVLKGIMDSAADYADVIKSTFVSPSSQQTPVTRSLDGTDYIESLCKKAKIAHPLERHISELMTEKRQLDQQVAEGEDIDGASDYIALAAELGKLVSTEFDATPPGLSASATSARSSLRISLLLEGALCRFLSEDRQQVRLAVAQYKTIAKEQPDNPICWFRQAQALAFLAVEAVPGSESADMLVREVSHAYERARWTVEKFDKGETPKDVHLSREEHAFIKANVAKLHGFALWRISDVKRRVSSIEQVDVERFCEACAISIAGIETATTADGRIRLVNNALYFACDAYESKAACLDTEIDLPLLPRVKTLFEELAKHCESSTTVPIGYWDTLVHAAVLLAEVDEGRRAASKVLDENTQILTPVSEFGSAYALEMRNRAVQFAWRVYRES